MRWDIDDDGSFTFTSSYGSLSGAWPGIDHRPVRARSVLVERTATGGRVRYDLAHARAISVVLDANDGVLTLGCELTGFAEAPLWVHPLADARVDGFARWFRQGQGFSGPSGFVPIDRATFRCLDAWSASGAGAPWTLDSYMLAGLANEAGFVACGPLRHRDFVWKAELHNRSIRGSFRNREVHENVALLEAGYRTERIAVPGGRLELPTIQLRAGADAFACLRAHARAIANANDVRLRQPPTYHYCSWYEKTEFFDETDVTAMIEGLRATDPDGAVQTIQIDDGHATSHGDWLTGHPQRWPRGLEPAFHRIIASGRRAGVWVGPFMVGSSSRLAHEHPEWLLRWTDGSLVTEWRHWDGAKPDLEHYVLDTSHPDAMAWLREVFRTLRRQGATFFKTDFLEWGFKDSTVVRRHTPGKTSAQYYDDVMRAIRGEIGPDSHWLACIAYFAPMVGYADGMRVSSDVGISWGGRGGTGNDGTGGGTQNMVEEMAATQYSNRVLWENDPDVVYLRDYQIQLPDGEWQALAAWVGILGGSVNTSDTFHRYPAERLAWWRFLRPSSDPAIAALPSFCRVGGLRVAVRAYATGWGVVVLNYTTDSIYEEISIAELVGMRSARCFRWAPGVAEDLGDIDRLREHLPGRRHRLVYVSRDGLPPPEDLTLGGARSLGQRPSDVRASHARP